MSELPIDEVICADVLEGLRGLPDESVHCLCGRQINQCGRYAGGNPCGPFVNINFPEAQHAEPTLLQVGVTLAVTPNVRLLNGIAGFWIDSRISVPEIAIPLDDQVRRGYQNVNDKSAADDFLFIVVNTKTRDNSAPRRLKAVCFGALRKAQHSIDTCHIGVVVAAAVGTIPCSSPACPCGAIEVLVTGWAAFNCAVAKISPASFLGRILGGSRLLPGIGTCDRAETHRAIAAAYKLHATMMARKSTARITPFGGVGSRRKRQATSDADFGRGSIVCHGDSIPWQVAKSKLAPQSIAHSPAPG